MQTERLTADIDAALDEQDFSGVIRIRLGADPVYERASGYADRGNRLPNTLETRFGIASGTKLLTAIAIGRLIEAGKLALDTRLADVVDLGYPQYSQDITIRHLLTHTSGIPDYYDEEEVHEFEGFKVAVPWSELLGPRDYLAIFPEGPMKFEPGERFSYSNGGYITLGIVIEEVSGTPYQEFVMREVLQRAGMARSGFFAMNRLPEKTAFGYIDDDAGWRTNVFDLPLVGASDGGAFTTAGDMTRLWDAFWSFELLSEATVVEFVGNYSRAEAEGDHVYYGHGIWLYDDGPGVREEYIVGCDAGVSFRSGRNSSTVLEVTVLANTTHGAWPILRAIDAVTRMPAHQG